MAYRRRIVAENVVEDVRDVSDHWQSVAGVNKAKPVNCFSFTVRARRTSGYLGVQERSTQCRKVDVVDAENETDPPPL